MKRILGILGGLVLALTIVAGCDKSNDITGDGTTTPDGTNMPDSLALARVFPRLLANGVDELMLYATVVDARGRGLTGIGVRFHATHGTVTPFGTTDDAGVAHATFTSEASVSDLSATVTADADQDTSGLGVPQGARVVVANRALTPALRAQAATGASGADRDRPVTLATATVYDAVEVPMTGVTIALAASPGTIPADGESVCRITAHVTETTLHIPLDAQEVLFGASEGTITGRGTTDDAGVTVAELIAAPGQTGAEVTAYYGQTLTRTVSVIFTEVPAAPPAATILLAVDVLSLPADGSSEAIVTATALDAQSNLVADGTLVTFSVVSGGGQFVAPVQSTRAGVAVATYVAGTSAGPVILHAVSGSAVATAPLTLVPLGAGASVTLASDASSILADGIAMVRLTAVVTDAFGHPVTPGTLVGFTTTSGLLDDITPTNDRGVAGARLRATPLQTGMARVTAAVSGVQDIVDVTFMSEAAAHIEVASVEPAAIGVRGAGDIETSIVIFTVRDRNGIPVDADHAAALAFHIQPVTGETDATIYPASATTNELGQARTTVNAGIESGAVEVYASSGALWSEPIRVAIHGGPPDPQHFSIAFNRVNVAGLKYFGIHDAVTAYVYDEHGNPVPEGTRVWFSTTHGGVQGSSGTNDHGEATVDVITAEPAPRESGFGWVTAQTVDAEGDWLTTDPGRLLWSGDTQILVTEPDPGFDMPNGGSIAIVFRVYDQNQNPLTLGTTISVTTSAGKVAGDIDTVLPDTQSQGYTYFAAVLSDDDPRTDEANAVTVAIKVTSQNGNLTTTITGTKH
jgi:hypothetical protein